MKRLKKSVGLIVVLTFSVLPYLAAKEKPAPQFEEQREAEEAARREQAEAQKARREHKSSRPR